MPSPRPERVDPSSRTILDLALARPTGINWRRSSVKSAKGAAFRLWATIRKDRLHNGHVYPEHHPMHNRSVYEGLQISVQECPDGTAIVAIIHDTELLNDADITDAATGEKLTASGTSTPASLDDLMGDQDSNPDPLNDSAPPSNQLDWMQEEDED